MEISRICRIWHGWTSPENAPAYEDLLKEEILPGIHRVNGYKGSQLYKRVLEDGKVEFITLTFFDSMDAVKEFAGDDFTRAVVPQKAQQLLSEYDKRSAHYELKFDDTILNK